MIENQTYSLDNLSSKSSEEEGNRDGTGSGGELSSASPGDFGVDATSVGKVAEPVLSWRMPPATCSLV